MTVDGGPGPRAAGDRDRKHFKLAGRAQTSSTPSTTSTSRSIAAASSPSSASPAPANPRSRGCWRSSCRDLGQDPAARRGCHAQGPPRVPPLRRPRPDDLPGPVRVAEPRPHRAVHPHAKHPASTADDSRGEELEQALPRSPRPRAAHAARALHRQVPAPAVGRPAAARRDRAGAVGRSRGAARRRAHLDARRLDPSRHPEPPERPARPPAASRSSTSRTTSPRRATSPTRRWSCTPDASSRPATRSRSPRTRCIRTLSCSSARRPIPDDLAARARGARGEAPSLVRPPSGCRFNPRCPVRDRPVPAPRCLRSSPAAEGRAAACWGYSDREDRPVLGSVLDAYGAPPEHRCAARSRREEAAR